MIEGYVRVHRSIAESPLWTCGPTVKVVMLAFLLKANFKAARWYDGAGEIEIPRGSFVSSYQKMAEFCGLTVKQTRVAFAHLERLHFAAYRRAGRYTMITVLRYGTYQDSVGEEGRMEGRQRAGKGQEEGTQRATIEEKQEEREEQTPLPRLAEEDGATAPLAFVSPGSEKPQQQSPTRKPYGEVLKQVAYSIHARHPNADGAAGRRDLSSLGVERALATILKHKHTMAADYEAYLRQIDRNHASACESEAWRKEDGQFVKSLRGWLAPREERYDVAPAAGSRKEPMRLMA